MESVQKFLTGAAAFFRTDRRTAAAAAVLRSVLVQAAAAAAAAALAGVEFVDGTYPFGLAFVIGVSDRFAVGSLAGFVLGSFLTSDVAWNSSYITAAGAVAATRWILAGLSRGKLRKNNFAACLIAGALAVLASETAILISTLQISLAAMLRLCAGTAVVCAFAYFYRTVFEAFKRKRTLQELPSAAKASLALSFCTAIMAVYGLRAGPFSLGRLAGIASAMYAAHLLCSPLDAAAFAAVAAAFALSEPAFAFAAAGVCVAGALSSLFKKRGRAVLCLVFTVCAALFAFCADNYVYSVTYLAELLLAALLFLVLPFGRQADARFAHAADSLMSATAAVGNRLECISSSLRDITSLLERTVTVADERPNADALINGAVEKVCRTCPVMSYCWVKSYGDTADALQKLMPALFKKGSVVREDLSPALRARCANAASLCRELSARYAAQLESIAKVKNTQLYKSLLKKQFSAVCEMLDGARDELCAMHDWDEQRSKRVYDCAARLSLPVETAGCIYDSEHRPVITVTLRDAASDAQLRRLTAGVSLIAGVTLSGPSARCADGDTVLTYTEKPLFTLRTAAAQLSAEQAACGDVYSVFADSRSNVHIVLSDGMGTGEAAARDGALCCAFLRRLLESGFRIRRAAELANTALALREDDEAASTLDVLSFNVYTGDATFFKAGAAATYCLHEERVRRIEGRTLPVGIYDRVSCREIPLLLSDGDIVVMTSDGAERADDPYIEQALLAHAADTAEAICRELLALAKKHGAGRDDVTVITARVEAARAAPEGDLN
ncbi:MAG: PP2C family protein-serine/threonine phosphatase [Oscillospiraceae bacterium]|nr:PP2C family protein-serine/threonine phosphatase [Oscillospiraceae bacterium]